MIVRLDSQRTMWECCQKGGGSEDKAMREDSFP